MAFEVGTILSPLDTGEPKKDKFEHQIVFDGDDLKRMGVNELPQVGQRKKIVAVGECIGVEVRDNPEKSDKDIRVTVQLRELDVQPLDDSPTSQKLYGG